MTHTPNAINWAFLITALLTGVLLIPWFFAAGFLSKFTLALLLVMIALAKLGFQAIKEQQLQLIWHSSHLPLIGFVISAIVSIFLTQPYPVSGLFGLGGFLVLVLLAIWLFAQILLPLAEAADRRGQNLSLVSRLQQQFLIGLAVATTILALTSILDHLGIGPAHWLNTLFGFAFPTDLRFSLAGSPLMAAELAAVTATGWIMLTLQHKRLTPLSLTAIATSVIVILLSIWAMLPSSPAALALPNWTVSWFIALDALRSFKSALIGFGTESYGSAYAQLKPVWMNGQSNWQIQFGSASNWPLTLMATQGLLGLAAFIGMIIAQFRLAKKLPAPLWPLAGMLLISVLLQLVLPLQVGLLLIQGMLMVLILMSQVQSTSFFKLKLPMPWAWAVGLSYLLMTAGLGWYYGKLLIAYGHLSLAERASRQSQVLKLYDHQRRAVALSPYIDLVRRQYALINLQLALALSTNPDVTDADKAQITQLVSQAIREGKAATVLDPKNSQNWIVLAEIYRNLATVSPEANQWTLSALISAVQTDPTNPILRLDLGQLLLEQNQPNDAAVTINQAIELKPDLPGGYYQLGRITRQAEQLDKTKSLWQKALSLLPATSEEYRTVSTSLKELETAIAATLSAKKLPPAPTPTPTLSSATDSALLRLTKDGSKAVLDEANPLNTERESAVVNPPVAVPQQ